MDEPEVSVDPLIWRNTVIDQKRETEWRCVTHHLTNYSIPRGVSGSSYLEEYGTVIDQKRETEWRCVTHHLTNYSIPRRWMTQRCQWTLLFGGIRYGNRSEERDRMEVCYAPLD